MESTGMQRYTHFMGTAIVMFIQLLIASATASNSSSFFASTETNLVAELLARYKQYNPHTVRPVMNASDTMWVQFGLGLVQILDFNEKEQILSTLVWKRYTWEDEYLTWNPADYDNLTEVLIHSSNLWVPDIVLYNNNGDSGVEKHAGLLNIYNNGHVVWIPVIRYLSSCEVDMTYFPVDEQACSFRFGSWAHSITKLDLKFLNQTDSIDLSNYLPNSEWAITENTAIKRKLRFDCCPEDYSDMIFTLKLKRQVTFHMRLILVPTILLTILSCAIFWIPPNRPDRTTLGLSLFSAFFLLLILVLTNSPPVRESNLGKYYIIVILLVSFGVLYSVIIINVSLKETRPPAFICKFIQAFSCCLCTTAAEEARKPLDGLTQTSLLSSNGGGAAVDTCRKSSSQDNKLKWQKFALLIDRFVFVSFLCCIIISFATVFPCPMSIFL